MAAIAGRLGLLWETNFPAVTGLVCGCLCFAFGPKAFAHMASHGWDIAAIYSSVFDLTTIFTAFLMTFYTFVITTGSGFIGRARGTRPYRLLLGYTFSALVLGSTLIAFSIPMMVIGPEPM